MDLSAQIAMQWKDRRLDCDSISNIALITPESILLDYYPMSVLLEVFV